MAQEKRKIIVSFAEDGSPIYKFLKAYSQDEMNVKIVKAFVESGRINEIIPSLHIASPSGNSILIKDYAVEWLNRKRKLKENSRVTYLKHINQYIIPCLGNLPLKSISVCDVQAMLDHYSSLSCKTLKEMKNTLSQIFKYAVSDEILKRNPCDSVDIVIPSTKKNERKALPLKQYQEIIGSLQNLTGDDKRFLALCLFTAMRRGEVLGLRWEDLFDGKIHIKRNVTHPQRNLPAITSPKTQAGIRTIPIIAPLSEALSPFENNGFIIGGENPITLSAYRAMWRRIQKTIKMHGATPHTLRHSYLTYAAGVTTDIKTIQGISGHADVFTLMNRYAHPQEEKVDALSAEMTKLFTQKVVLSETDEPVDNQRTEGD